MTDLPTREHLAELVAKCIGRNCDDDAINAAYSAGLTRIEELEKKLAIAVNAAGVEDARATAAEQEVVRLRKARVKMAADVVAGHGHWNDCFICEGLRTIAAEGDS